MCEVYNMVRYMLIKLEQNRVSALADFRAGATRLLAKIITRTKPLTSTNDCAGYHVGPILAKLPTGFLAQNATHDVCLTGNRRAALRWQLAGGRGRVGDGARSRRSQ